LTVGKMSRDIQAQARKLAPYRIYHAEDGLNQTSFF
jgi:hypothetical protein